MSLPRLALTLSLAFLTLAAPGCGRREPPNPLSPGLHAETIGGTWIAYHVHGAGPVIVAHPGGPGLEWSYERMREVEAFATVVYIEPIGTGNSSRQPGPRGFSLERYAADVESLRTKLKLEKFILLGHSHGGFVAQTYALAHPERLTGLILYDTTPTTGPEWEKDVEAGLEAYKSEPWFPEAAEALSQETSATTDSAITSIFRREYPLYFADYTRRAKEFDGYRATARAYVAPMRAAAPSDKVGVAPQIEVRDRLASIAVPTLVIVGKKDFVTPEKYSRIIHDSIRDSRLVVLENSGHMGHMEEPAAFADAVRQFVSSLPR